MKNRILSFLLAISLLVMLLPTAVFAVDNYGSFAEYRTKTNGVWGSWISVSDGATLKSAINDKSDLTVEVYMNRDWNLSDDWTRTVLWTTYGDRITIGSNSDVTIHMRGYAIDRGLTSNEDYANVFSLGSGAKLTLIGSESDTEAAREHTVRDYASNTGGSVTKTVTGGTLTGCYSKPTLEGQGGAIYFGGDGASVVLQDVTIAGNYFKNNGPGVRFNADNCSLTMDNSKILYNYGGGYGGGVVCEDKDSCSLVMDNGSEISYNAAGDGGGVYINNDSFTLTGDGTAQICGNSASSDGGGIYCNADNGNVSGCIIDGNSAGSSGGGVYFNDAFISVGGNRVAGLGACTVTNNTAGTGGGIFVEDAFTLTLSGLTTIEDNHNTSNADSNLYLKTGALLDLQNDTRSVIHFGVQSPSNNLQLSSAAGTYAEFNYFYDGSGYHAKWYDDVDRSDGKYRFLYLVTGDADVIPDPTAVGLEAKVALEDYVVDSTAYSLYATYFTFSVITDAENDLDAVCFYSDGYFFEDPTAYNEHLSTMSAALMAAGYYTNRGKVGTYGYENETENQYYNKHASLRQLLANIGCEDETIYVNQFNLEQPGMDSIGVGMAHKTLRTADGTDTGYILVPVSIRGSGYEAEWTSNVTVGPGGEHLGFAVAANTVYSEILGYIDAYGLTEAAQQGRLVFWVTGYSRSGATANLVAKRLIDHQSPALTFNLDTDTTLDAAALAGVSDDGFGANKVFCYTFEAAQGGTDAAEQSADKAVYYAIHNVVNKADAVPYVGPTEMGFKRYGVDHYLPGGAAGAVQTTVTNITRGASGDTTVTTYRDNDYYAVGGTEYQTMRSAAIEHMAAVNPYMVFDDYFTTATLNWVGGNLPSWMPSWLGKKDLNTAVSSDVSVETYLEELMAHLQDWGIPSRTWFATEVAELNGTSYTTFQQALRDVFEILYSMPDGAGGLMNGLDMSGLSIPYTKIYDLYYNVIRGWCNQTESKKEELLDWVWTDVVSSSGLLDSFTDTQINNLHQAWPTIADPLLTILSMDHNDETLVSGTGQVYLGTLLYNVNRILNNHFAETLFGWLRADDSYYSNETTRYAITRPTTVAQPGANAEAADMDDLTLTPSAPTATRCGDQTLHLDVDTTAGEAIYYTLNDGTTTSGQTLYADGIALAAPGENELPIVYTVSAYAISYGQRSDPVSYTVTVYDGHSYTVGYVWSANSATCTGTAVCAHCGKELTETVSSTSAAVTVSGLPYTRYTADFSGLPFAQQTRDVAAYAAFNGYNLGLEGEILVNSYLLVSQDLLNADDGIYATLDGGDPIQLKNMTATGDGYKFTLAKPAKEMNEVLTLCLYNSADEQIPILVGSELFDSVSYSIQTYLQQVIDNAASYDAEHPGLSALCKAMRAYGSYAQVQQNYTAFTGASCDPVQIDEDTASAVNAISASSIAAAATASTTTNSIDGLSFYGASLIMLDEMTLRFYFSYTGSGTLSSGGKSLGRNGSYYYADVTGIAPKDFGVGQTVTVSDGTNTCTVSGYSVNRYVYKVLTNESVNANMRNLAKAVAWYGMKAEEYFGSIS